MEIAIGSLILRTANFILWTLVVIRVFKHDKPVSRLARQLISIVLFFGMGILDIGALVPFGIVSSEVSRTVYTAFTAFAGLIALGIITTRDNESPNRSSS